MIEFTLHHYWRSSSSWRVRWALELKRVKPKYVHVGLLDGEVEKPAHMALNPMAFVPVLVADGRTLIESLAIIEWLDEIIPMPSLHPGDSWSRAHIRALCEIVNAGIQPVCNLNVLDAAAELGGDRKAWSQKFIGVGLDAFEKLVSKSAGKFCSGDEVSAADLCLIPQVYNARRNEIDVSRWPTIARIEKNALETEACKASHPDRFEPK